MTVTDLEARTLRLPMSRLHQVAEEVAGTPGHHLRIESTVPASRAMAAYWRAQVRFVTGAMLAPESPLGHPLVREETARATALAALHVFPNTTMDREHLPGPGWVEPAALRRAVAYVEAHAHEPITLTDIAAAARTAPRAVQYALRRHRGTTPMGHLRRVRLERAHRDLQHADPSRGATVAAIAARWGFAHPGKFAATYAAAYGRPPSHTLRH